MKTETLPEIKLDMSLPLVELLSNALPRLSGKLWIGDPCYVVPDASWDDVCTQMFSGRFKDCSEYLFRSYGVEFFVAGTAYGDGCYPVYQNGIRIGSCGVDAGLLSAIPVELIEEWRKLDSRNGEPADLGVFVDVGPRPQQVRLIGESDRNGRCGNWGIGDLIEVYTGDDNPYHREEEDEEADEENN